MYIKPPEGFSLLQKYDINHLFEEISMVNNKILTAFKVKYNILARIV